MSTKYNLSEAQLIKITRLCNQEQGTVKGCRAEASLMCNLYEKNGKAYGLGANGLYNYVRQSGWFARASYHMDNGTYTKAQLEAVRDVIVNGNRFFPINTIDEHDCISDIKWIKNYGSLADKNDRSNYIKNVTQIRNVYGSTYIFYCFPDSYCDPFGYTSEEKIHDPCVSISFEEIYLGVTCEDVKICQRMLRSRGYKGKLSKTLKITGDFDENTEYALLSFQRYHKLVADGICGAKTWQKLMGK